MKIIQFEASLHLSLANPFARLSKLKKDHPMNDEIVGAAARLHFRVSRPRGYHQSFTASCPVASATSEHPVHVPSYVALSVRLKMDGPYCAALLEEE